MARQSEWEASDNQDEELGSRLGDDCRWRFELQAFYSVDCRCATIVDRFSVFAGWHVNWRPSDGDGLIEAPF
jgi:hypothetical protein